MSEKKTSGVPFSSESEAEQLLWDALEKTHMDEPPPRLRRKFYSELDSLGRGTRMDRWGSWFGMTDGRGLATALSCILLGIVMGVTIDEFRGVDRAELSNLQQQVAQLNRSLILDRMTSVSASKRLLGVIEAAAVADQDAEIARALLTRAADDRVYSVRAAAIDAIGPQLTSPAVGDELMSLLENAQSPIVQRALVDLVLRHGNPQQLEQLMQLTERGALHPDLVRHVQSAVWRDRA